MLEPRLGPRITLRFFQREAALFRRATLLVRESGLRTPAEVHANQVRAVGVRGTTVFCTAIGGDSSPHLINVLDRLFAVELLSDSAWERLDKRQSQMHSELLEHFFRPSWV